MRWRNLAAVGAGISVVGIAGFSLLNPAPPGPVSLETTVSAANLGASAPETPDGEWLVTPSEEVFVGYRAREKLDFMDGSTVSAPHDAVGRTTAVEGSLRIKGQRLLETTIRADLRELRSDRKMRDGHVSGALGFEQHPYAQFELKAPVELGTPSLGKIVESSAEGVLTIGKKSRPATFELQARWNGPTIQVSGQTVVKRSDFALETGQFLLFRVADDFVVEVQLTFAPACGDSPCESVTESMSPIVSSTTSTSQASSTGGVPPSNEGALVFVGIAFTPEGQVLEPHLYQVAADGSGLTQLTEGPGEFGPALGPDGQIAYNRHGPTDGQVWIRHPDGKERQIHPEVRLSAVDFSPDGTQLVGVMTSGQLENPNDPLRTDLAIVDLVTDTLRLLTNDGAFKDLPAWSPDGQLIAYQMATEGEGSEEIFTIRIDGTEVTRRTTDTGYDYAVEWLSADTLLFVREGQLIILDLETSIEKRIPVAGNVNLPAPAPDGARAVVTIDDGLALVDLTTGGTTPIQLDFDVATQPEWISGASE